MSEAAKTRVNDFNSQGLAHTVSAFDKHGQASSAIFDAIAKVAMSCSDFSSHSLAYTVWAFATLSQASSVPFDATTEAATRRLSDFKSQSLANTVWAFASCAQASPALCDASAEAATTRCTDFNSQRLENIVIFAISISAVTTVGHASPERYDAFAEVAISYQNKFSHRGPANTVWAFATQCVLFWAFATACHTSPALSDALFEAVKIWAFAGIGCASPILCDAITEVAISLLCAVDAPPAAQYLAQALLPDFIMAMTASIGNRSRIPFPTPGKARIVWTFSTELLAHTAVSLTCAVGDIPGAQYLAWALIANYIMAMTASFGIGTRIVFRHLEGLYGLDLQQSRPSAV